MKKAVILLLVLTSMMLCAMISVFGCGTSMAPVIPPTTVTTAPTPTTTLGYITYHISGEVFQGLCPYSSAVVALYKGSPTGGGVYVALTHSLTFESGKASYSISYGTNEASPRNYYLFAQSPWSQAEGTNPVFISIKFITLEGVANLTYSFTYETMSGMITFPTQEVESCLVLMTTKTSDSGLDGFAQYVIASGESSRHYVVPVTSHGQHALFGILEVGTNEYRSQNIGDYVGVYSSGQLPPPYGEGVPEQINFNGSLVLNDFTILNQIEGQKVGPKIGALTIPTGNQIYPRINKISYKH